MKESYVRACAVLFFMLCLLIHTKGYGAEKPITVVLERVYIGGDISEEIYTTSETFAEIKETLQEWCFVSGDDSQVIFQKNINDISPVMKSNGYLGISSDGVLKIFEGTPNGERVIQSFFQVDTKKLQSYQRHQLKKGIKINTKSKYQKLIDEMEVYHKN